MKSLQSFGVFAAPLTAASFLANVAHACPMCFSGGNSNSSAFVIGSLFMMGVPVTALGILVTLAYRRIKVADERNAAGLGPRKPIVVTPPVANEAHGSNSTSQLTAIAK
jgi:hypothetical protein